MEGFMLKNFILVVSLKYLLGQIQNIVNTEKSRVITQYKTLGAKWLPAFCIDSGFIA
jgi:hypothetical protein